MSSIALILTVKLCDGFDGKQYFVITESYYCSLIAMENLVFNLIVALIGQGEKK